MTERFPIEGHLVPAERPTSPEGMTRLAVPLARGVPQTVELDRDVSLVVVMPTGVAVTWRDADPLAPVSTGGEQFASARSSGQTSAPPLNRGAPRALVLLRDSVVASLPLVAGSRRRGPDDGGDGGEIVELAILDWELRAGTLRGAGAFGSRLDVAFRRSDSGSARFATPATHPHLADRRAAGQRFESGVGRES
jgi:hypothetical protein